MRGSFWLTLLVLTTGMIGPVLRHRQMIPLAIAGAIVFFVVAYHARLIVHIVTILF